NGELYAGGYFDNAGNIPASNIAKWNGSNWLPVSTGTNGEVLALCVFSGELYAGGSFSIAGGIPANDIAKWNGTTWSSVGSPDCYSIKSLTVYNGELYAAGFFIFPGFPDGTSIAKWNGTTWAPVGSGVEPVINYAECLAVYNGELYVAGAHIGGGGVAQSFSILKWNGLSWSTLITMDAGLTLDGALGDILSMTVYNGELYVAGMCFGMMIDSVLTSQIAKWNGTNWSAVGTGINAGSSPLGGDSDGSTYTYVKCLAVYNGALYAGGRFSYADTIATTNIAKWDGNNWSGLQQGVYGHVYALSAFDTSLYVGGWFTAVNGNNIPANKIAKWKDSCAVALPSQPAIIYGSNTVCQGSTQTYLIDTIPGATSYYWILPPGWTGNSNSSSITAITGSNGGEIKAIAVNSCGNSMPKTMAVTVNPLPTQLSEIYGNDVVCAGNTVSYSTNHSPGTSYSWNLPPGWIGTSTTSNITAIAGNTGGMISVAASNSCGSSNPQTLLIDVDSIPGRPLLINGNDTICEGDTQTYFIDPVPGATGYTWDLTFGSAVGFDSTIIAITAHYSGYPDDFITVSAYNNCGNSDMLTMPVKVNLLPYQPNRIFGNNLVCRGSNQTYFIDPLPDATSYTWIIPSGWTGNSNTSAITANVGNETGNISVRANNSCGGGAFTSLPILLDTVPSKPGTINGNAYVAAGEKHGYSVDVTSRPPGYNWSLSGGGNLTAGQSPHKIEIDWQTPGTYVLSVKSINSCGGSPDQTLTIKVSSANPEDPYSFQLFPNPSTGEFYLKAKRLQDKWIGVEVLSMSGQLVFRSEKRSGSNDYSQLIDLDKMSPALYVIRIIVDDQVFAEKISIIR
ncbi:MAG TPA: T9SS type A sorting domain-containing protein, partial [Flavitalea sp.]|nr:T9SS type A sorting domain-containing protein [Flavitalea sp.]